MEKWKDGHALHVLRSIELNLNPVGAGDKDRRSLSELDLVLGCFHPALRRKEDQTERTIRQRCETRRLMSWVIGAGASLNYRFGLKADWRRVFDFGCGTG